MSLIGLNGGIDLIFNQNRKSLGGALIHDDQIRFSSVVAFGNEHRFDLALRLYEPRSGFEPVGKAGIHGEFFCKKNVDVSLVFALN